MYELTHERSNNMLVKMETGASGGTPEWILDATISGTSFSASWDFDAETILIFIISYNYFFTKVAKKIQKHVSPCIISQ